MVISLDHLSASIILLVSEKFEFGRQVLGHVLRLMAGCEVSQCIAEDPVESGRIHLCSCSFETAIALFSQQPLVCTRGVVASTVATLPKQMMANLWQADEEKGGWLACICINDALVKGNH